MIRKDYETIAHTIAATLDGAVMPEQRLAIRELTRELARAFHEDNPRFDTGRFLNASWTLL